MSVESIKKVLKTQLSRCIDDLDCGNSDYSEEELIEILDKIKLISDKTRRVSKYEACKYLKISRATFDNYIRQGKIPKGTQQQGFKELSWDIKTLDEFKEKYKDNAK